MVHLTSPLLLIALAGCAGDKTTSTDDTGPTGGTDSGVSTDDTGTPDTWPYEEGCIAVSSTAPGTFANFDEAVAAAEDAENAGA